MNSSVKLVVRALYRYPVKSCGAEPVDALEFAQNGLVRGDREWIVVDEQANAVWLGSHPRLAVVRPRLRAEGLTLVNGVGDRVDVPLVGDADQVKFQVWNDTTKCHEVHRGSDAGHEAARFLQQTAGPGLRLVRLGRAALQRSGLNAVHIAAEDSYQEFLAALPPDQRERGHLLRFRPNVVLGGLDERLVPFIEDQLTQLEWSSSQGSGTLEVTSPCIRCVAPNIDPDSGSVDNSILETVSKLSVQRNPTQPICFGVYARSPGQGVLTRDAVMTGTIAF